MRPPAPTARDQGETLVEILVAVVILGLAAVVIVGGLTLSAKVSDIHRKQANASAYVRNYAESIESTVAGGGYAAGAASYPAYAPPGGYIASLTSKQCYTGVTTAAWTACTSTNDLGVQQLTLQVRSPDSRATEQLVIVVRKPCVAAGCT